MSCPAIASGDAFLGSTLDYLDCAGQQLGETGYQAMSAPGSIVGEVLLACFTLFIAIQGFRLMFGQRLDIGDATVAAVKIGLVLLLATSWPAVRTLFHDTAVKGPAELVAQIGGNPAAMTSQLQLVDSGMVALTKWGTGKLDIRAGRTASGSPAASAFAGEAADESTAFSGGRLFFLVSAIAAIGVPRLLGGLLLSVLPILAGLILFDRARGVAAGWARAWLFAFLGGFVASVLLAIEAAMLQPWLSRVIAERAASLATPSAPTELMAMTGAFAVMILAVLALVARFCFASDPVVIVGRAWHAGAEWASHRTNASAPPQPAIATVGLEPSRVHQISSAITAQGRREQLSMRPSHSLEVKSTSEPNVDNAANSESRRSQRPRRASPRLARSSRKRDLQ